MKDQLNNLLKKGRLLPVYRREEDTILLVGYQRKAHSRKSHQRPVMLKAPVPIAKIPQNPEA